MNFESLYYQCSADYIDTVSPTLRNQIIETIEIMPKRQSESDIKFDLFWLLTSVGWSYDSVPAGISTVPPECFELECTLESIAPNNDRKRCLASTTLDNCWHADFAKQFDAGLVHLQAQFGSTAAMIKDLCGFRIAYAENRLALGIEILLLDPASYFADQEQPVADITTFQSAKGTLDMLDLDCPIWLIGIQF